LDVELRSGAVASIDPFEPPYELLPGARGNGLRIEAVPEIVRNIEGG
jgi:hypothetical protein